VLIRGARTCPATLFAVALAGCAHLGPRAVIADRLDYSSAIGDSWKQQTLLNIVKARYADLAVFVDVSSVVSGYSREAAVTLGTDAAGTVRFTDRPTITYTPLTGDKFLRGMVTPLAPKTIFFMIQSGYPADFILNLTVESLNGLRNRSANPGDSQQADPDFRRAIDLLRAIQAAGAVGMRVEEDAAKTESPVLFFRSRKIAPDIQDKEKEFRALLGLAAGEDKYAIVYSPVQGTDREIAVSSRSMLQIMAGFSNAVQAPAADLASGSVRAPDGAAVDGAQGRLRVLSGEKKPKAAFASVEYRGHWFWVDDSDWNTKRALTAIMYFFTLTETGSPDKLPLVTIPAQ
jgi:hypothetical protein